MNFMWDIHQRKDTKNGRGSIQDRGEGTERRMKLGLTEALSK